MVSIEMAMLRVAEADRDENDDIASANAQVWAQRWTAMDQRLAIARRAVAILENELQRLAQFAPKQQAQAGQAPPAQQRLAPVRREAKEAQGG
jgi:hypothetical protein